MPHELDELLSAMNEAASSNRQAEFDRLERQLLDLYEGGFSGMPREIYERYLEVDRAWPTVPRRQPDDQSLDIPGLGPRTPVSARVPAVLLDWVHDQATAHTRSRSDVLALCLRMVMDDPGLSERLIAKLRGRD